jgi:hypothetical protein
MPVDRVWNREEAWANREHILRVAVQLRAAYAAEMTLKQIGLADAEGLVRIAALAKLLEQAVAAEVMFNGADYAYMNIAPAELSKLLQE